MAFIEHKECPICEKITHHCNGKCSDCYARNERTRLNKWRCMSYDERLEDLRKRLEDIERGPPRF